jgi:hypothetical protein
MGRKWRLGTHRTVCGGVPESSNIGAGGLHRGDEPTGLLALAKRGTRLHGLSRKATAAVVLTGAVALSLSVWGSMASANSSAYNPPQNDCAWNADAYNTTPNETYPGCHSTALNVESGSTTNGNADSTNTRYLEYGGDQNGVDPNSQGTDTEYSLGYPGDTGNPHAGCLSANTDGTDHVADPQNSTDTDTPSPSGPKTEDSAYGCGNNPNGAGFEANYDYYQYYCPVAAKLPTESVPDGPTSGPCEDPSTPGNTTVTPDLGSGVDYQPIVADGLIIYYGMDDNNDNTEHDGFDGCNVNEGGQVAQRCAGTGSGCPANNTDPGCNDAGQTNTDTDGAINGPSDGGGMVLSFTPQNATNTPSETNPEGLVNFSADFCADGLCTGATTQQQTIYYGCYDPNNPDDAAWNASGTDGATNPQNNKDDDECAEGTPESTDSFENNSPAATEASPNCDSGGPYGGPQGTEEPCFTNVNGTSNGSPNTTNSDGGANDYRQNTPQQVNDEPGVQTNADPDPERSPAAPFEMPGVYVGTCGAYLNDSGGEQPGVTNTVTGGKVAGPDPGWIAKAPDPDC